MMAAELTTSRGVERKRRNRRRFAASAWRDRTIAKLFSEIKRSRALDEEEKKLFDRALAGAGPKREIWRWTEKEDRRLLALIQQRHRLGRPKPFQPNVEVLNISIELNRSYMAVHRRIERLRKQMKCSDANAKRGG